MLRGSHEIVDLWRELEFLEEFICSSARGNSFGVVAAITFVSPTMPADVALATRSKAHTATFASTPNRVRFSVLVSVLAMGDASQNSSCGGRTDGSISSPVGL